MTAKNELEAACAAKDVALRKITYVSDGRFFIGINGDEDVTDLVGLALSSAAGTGWLPPQEAEKLHSVHNQLQREWQFQRDKVRDLELENASIRGASGFKTREAKQATEAKLAAANAGLRRIIEGVPATDGQGGLCVLHHDGDGNELGMEQVDPLAVIQSIVGVAHEALAESDPTPIKPQMSDGELANKLLCVLTQEMIRKSELFDYLCWLEEKEQGERVPEADFLVLASDGRTCWGKSYAAAVAAAMKYDAKPYGEHQNVGLSDSL